ncbi:fasciclin domain-containing protein [Spirosoma sp. RP8]|uniref:Fasciclin domain-containing protein n=1 Tax=Spirosoma liriopis TaxID=2937440 RepID=A0ABT0HUU7_9BACT|nr:fasciclin domain-containing protein [Spirosoma liriopis]MCK8495956.1 fasciclin domain-containing protein [Spirosoma liriopis]
MFQFIRAGFRQSSLLLLFAAGPFFFSCTKETPAPAPGTGTTNPGSGTVTTPGTGTATTPGTGTATTPGTGTATTPGTTVVASVTYIAQKDNLNLLEAAILRAGLTSEFNKENATIFAPSDEAFKAAGYANEAAIQAAPAADLQRILRYHLVNSRIDQSSIPTGVNTVYQTALADNTISVYKVSNSDISVNQAKIIQGDNPTVGSVVHIINQVLTPATVNVVTLAKNNANLSFLAAAIDRAGASVQDVLNKNTQNGYTIFAPTNDAFKAAGYADEAAIKAADQQKLASLLLYHVLNYRAYAQTFQNGADIVTAQGGSVRVNVSNGKVTLTGKGNGSNAATVTQADQVASNGIIVHVIDRVLLSQ